MSRTDGQEQPVFSRRVVLALIFIGVFAASGFIVLTGFAPVLRNNNDGGAHALSKGSTGYAALYSLLRELDLPVVIQRDDDTTGGEGLLVLTPPGGEDLNTDGAALSPDRITLIVPPKWLTTPLPVKRGWVAKVAVNSLDALSFRTADTTHTIKLATADDTADISLKPVDWPAQPAMQAMADGDIGAIDHLRSIEPDDTIEPVVTTEDGAILVARVKDTPVWIVADADLLNTEGLKQLSRAQFAAGLINALRYDGPIALDVTLFGFERTRNIIQLALEPPFMAGSLIAVLAAILLAWLSFFRFGPPEATPPVHDFGKAALADNSAALIRMARRELDYAARYTDVLRRRIARRLGVTRPMTAHDVDETLARMTGPRRQEDSFTALSIRATRAADERELVAAAQRLYDIKKEIVRERR